MDRPFETDGCSGGLSLIWRLATGRPPPWEGACVDHDRAYWAGGDKRDRFVADADLLRRVGGAGHPVIAVLMFLAVRVGGHPLLPLPWRWGYGWRWPRRYRKP